MEEEKKGEDIANEESPKDPNGTILNNKGSKKAEDKTSAADKDTGIKALSKEEKEVYGHFQTAWKEDMVEKVLSKLNKKEIEEF